MDLFFLFFLSIYFMLSHVIVAGTKRKVEGLFLLWNLIDLSAVIIAHTPVFETVTYDIKYTILHHFSFDV